MKVKLSVTGIEKFKMACEATDIRIDETKEYGHKTVCVVNIRHASQLYEAGLIQATLKEVTPTDPPPTIKDTQSTERPNFSSKDGQDNKAKK